MNTKELPKDRPFLVRTNGEFLEIWRWHEADPEHPIKHPAGFYDDCGELTSECYIKDWQEIII